MAAGDWHPDSGLRPGIFNVTVDDAGQVNHVGVGYAVLTPTGRVVHETGLTVTLPPDAAEKLQQAIDAAWSAVCAHEGLGG